MIRKRLSWVIVGAVLALGAVAAVDVLRSSGASTSSQATPTRAEEVTFSIQTEAAPVARCKTQQLALEIEKLGGSPALALVHAWAGPCRTPRLPIDITLLDRTGHSVQATVGVQPAFRPTVLAPNIELIAGFNFVYLCGQPKPVRFLAEAGPYAVRGRLPRGRAACFNDLGP
jgi:hypothetical protein